MSTLDTIKDILQQGGVSKSTVYNRYLPNDFNYGADNLNPVRELDVFDDVGSVLSSQGVLDTVDALRIRFYEAYKLRLDELKKEAELLGAYDSSKLTNPSEVGGSFESKTDIDITVSLQDGLRGSDYDTGLTNSAYDNILSLIGSLELLLDSDGVISLEDLPVDLCGDRNGTSAIGPLFNNTAGGSSSSSSTGSTGSSGLEGVDGSDDSTESSERQHNSDECLDLQLEILDTIRGWLQILTILQKMLNTMLSIVTPIAQITTLIGGCWVNPAALGEMAQQLVGNALAGVITILTQIIRYALGQTTLGCNINELLATGQDILSLVNGVADKGSDLYSFITFANPELVAYANAGASMAESFQSLEDKEYKNVFTEFMNGFSEGFNESTDKKILSALVTSGSTFTSDASGVTGLISDAIDTADRFQVVTEEQVTEDTERNVKNYFKYGFETR